MINEIFTFKCENKNKKIQKKHFDKLLLVNSMVDIITNTNFIEPVAVSSQRPL